MLNPMPLSKLEADLRRRLRRIDPKSDAGNGQLLADAAATLIAADALQAGVEPQVVARMSDDDLAAVLPLVAKLISDRTVWVSALPFGTEARGIDPGLVAIGDQHYVMVDIWGGMAREHEAPIAQEGPNLDRFLAELQAATAGLPCGALGLPTAITEGSLAPEHLLHFGPCAAAGGVSLDVLIERPIHQIPHDAFKEIIHSTVWAMEIFWRQREAMARRARYVRSTFKAKVALTGALANAVAGGLTIVDFRSRPFEFVDSNCETIPDKLSLYLGLTGFNGAFRPDVDHWLMIGRADARETIQVVIKRYIKDLAKVAHGPWLLIDGLAASIAEAAPGGATPVLKRLSRQLATDVVLPISRGRQLVVQLYWSDGIIRASSDHHRHVQFTDTEVTLRNYPLPDTIKDALIGRRLDEVVDLPTSRAPTIRAVEYPYPNALILHLDNALHDVDLTSGTIGKPVPF